jgi:hypothetical protein
VHVVPVEGDVERPEGKLRPAALGDEPAQPEASGTPRVWMPTRATRSRSAFRSTISCAIRESVREIAASSRRAFAPVDTGSARPGTCVVISLLSGLAGPG